ncbi:hypothetical protein CQ059_22085 [Brucella pseudogrignonensis]|uniref:Uncharacterized protein n=1 Tax=Brucella pseudogrignonensis TaxID=419475 RepID=A0A1A9FW92_9HYPH|nr:hypothetical protein A8A54_22715 [Brucella pseudogrignonensis]OYR23476.1 hypothetical protein CEV34_3480 [Brucella pseudogrignonensis]PQZ39296.1 hypothetical protein CQ059_22085 [Brucella pseudogrignonensis]PRA41202.1 hypothetical protein CQ063_11955 [Brucella pseudogrignonensis]PRA70028.1 hypothetical protein CQ055_11840 [Brucella pseudogrignonensis]
MQPLCARGFERRRWLTIGIGARQLGQSKSKIARIDDQDAVATGSTGRRRIARECLVLDPLHFVAATAPGRIGVASIGCKAGATEPVEPL